MPEELIHFGGENATRTQRHRYFEEIKLKVLAEDKIAPVVTAAVPLLEDESRLSIRGRDFTPASQVLIDGRFYPAEFVSSEELRISLPDNLQLKPHSSIVVNTFPLFTLNRIDKRRTNLTIMNVRPLTAIPLKTANPFTLSIEFQPAQNVQARLLRLIATFPDGQKLTQFYEISRAENEEGRKLIEDVAVNNGGNLEVDVTIYDELGNADYSEHLFPVVPSNPVQLYVYPQHYSTGTYSGAAEYRSGENRYYCEGRWVIANGNSHAVTIGPRVRCRVSDAGLGELADFTFDITQRTVSANSSITIYVYTSHGSSSDVYDLFRDFGDAKYEFWLQTSEGDKYDWNVWVAMAQVGLTANFVGSFSWTERVKVQDIIDTYSTGIYSKVDCYFTPDTPILEIPSSDSDWSRYRDIRVEEDKDGDCVDSDEADDLRDDWSSPSQYDDRIDIFFVESFSGDACASSLGGFSPINGPTGKGGDNSGIVIDVKDMNILTSSWGEQVLGVIIAHEVGHFLDLKHSSTNNNFMEASVGTSNTDITYSQWQAMRDHGFVKRLNP